MAHNKVQYKQGLSMPGLFKLYGSAPQCQVPTGGVAMAPGLCVSALGGRRPQRVSTPVLAVLPVRLMSLPVQLGQRHRLRVQQTATAHVVPGHALDGRRPRTASRPWRSSAIWGCPPHRLAAQAQAHAGRQWTASHGVGSPTASKSPTPASAVKPRAARPAGARSTRCPWWRPRRPPGPASPCSCRPPGPLHTRYRPVTGPLQARYGAVATAQIFTTPTIGSLPNQALVQAPLPVTARAIQLVPLP